MRHASIFTVLVCAATPAAADPTSIEQNGRTNLAVIDVGKSSPSSDLIFKQSGNLNGISSSQRASDNGISSSQYGWRNTITIYQNGWTDVSQVVQSGPDEKGGRYNLPTSYLTENTDNGYLTYFTSGGFSLVTLGEPGSSITSHFGRLR